MGVPSSAVYVKYTANGATTVFAYPFKLQSSAQLGVLVNDVVQVSGFTISGIGADVGGNVTFSVAPVNGAIVYLRRSSDMDRDTTYNESNFLVGTVNDDQDYQTMLVQEVNDKADRSFHVEQGSGIDTAMPDPQPNYLLGWNSGGSALVNIQALSGTLSNVDYKFSSVSAMSAQTGMTNGALAQTFGYYTANDGGHGQYRYDSTSVATANGGTIITASGGGRWLLLYDGEVHFKQFGATGDGTTDDTSAVAAALSAGVPLYAGASPLNYAITSEISITLASPLLLRSDGATIKVTAVSSIRSAIQVDMAGKDVSLTGRLYLDCNNKSYSGFYSTNYGSGIAKANALISGLEVSNCYRAATTFTGGDGIFIGGNLHKLRIVDCSTTNIKMATGAGIAGSQGVSGITVSRDNTYDLDSSLTVIDGCLIGPVYCEDVTYTMDQDGLKVFTAYSDAGDYPRPVWASITNSRFINCHGRSIKIQTEFAAVENCKIERNSDIYGSGYTGNPEIDFQTGGGQVSNIQCFYRSNFPSRVLNFTLTRDDTRLNPTAVSVNGLSVYQAGSGTGIDRIAAVYTQYDATAPISFSGCSLLGSKTPTYFLTVQSDVTAGWFGVNLDGIAGRAATSFVYRLSSVATPCFVTGKAIWNQGSSVPFAASTVGTDFTSSLIGTNRLVT